MPVCSENPPIDTNPYCIYSLTCQFIKEREKNGNCTHYSLGKCNYGEACNKIHGTSRVPCKNGHHAKIYCKEANTKRKNGISIACNWHARDELVLDNFLEDPAYVVAARPTPTRDILVCPIDHVTNIELVKSEPFWKIILITITKLQDLTKIQCPIEMISINFGLWETQQSEDKNAIGCHGHFHLNLTESGMKALQTVKEYENPLRGRNGHPDDYREKDIERLESSRLVGDEVLVLSTRLDRVEKDLEEIKSLLKQLLQQGNK